MKTYLKQKRVQRGIFFTFIVLLSLAFLAAFNQRKPEKAFVLQEPIASESTTYQTIIQNHYQEWKSTYLEQDEEAFYVNQSALKKQASLPASTSEGHGYGMLILVKMANSDASAQKYFDGMVRFYQSHTAASQTALMASQQKTDSQTQLLVNVAKEDETSSTAGDLDIAYALLIADKKWGSNGCINYLSLAQKLIHDIMAYEINNTNYLPLINNSIQKADSKINLLRSSDIRPAHFTAFYQATKEPDWLKVRGNSYHVLTDFTEENTALLPDFLSYNLQQEKWQPAPTTSLAVENTNNYSWNATTLPMQIGSDVLLTNDNQGVSYLSQLTRWVKKELQEHSKITAGYQLNGNSSTSSSSTAFASTFLAGASYLDASSELSNNLWKLAIEKPESPEYLNDTITLLALLSLRPTTSEKTLIN